MSYYNYTYTSAADLERNIQASLRQAERKGLHYEPVRVTHRKREICSTWWGQAWCHNLERYADYANRIDRGKRYVRNGTILDLKITAGRVEAKVQGSRKKPYDVTIYVDELKPKIKEELLARVNRRISSLEHLVNGQFPEELKEILMERDGLFPSPRQIHFDCSCPDWAYMCKHVAAVMYGIGVRLDENPLHFFTLRGLDVEDFIYKSAENKVEAMLENAEKPSPRILEGADLEDLFGLD